MTTMVAMDSFDTPMLDYMADDITMQIGPSTSSNSWAQQEAAMEDDDPHFQAEDVEIDMEPYDPENLEYEMTDEASVNQPNADELLDVEVFDAVEDRDFSSHIDVNDMRAADGRISGLKSPIPQGADAHYIGESYSESMLAPPTLPSSIPQNKGVVDAVISAVASAYHDSYEPPAGPLVISSVTDDNVQPQEQPESDAEPHHAQPDQQNHLSVVHLPVGVEVSYTESNTVEHLEPAPVVDRKEGEGVEDEHHVEQGDALSHESTGDPHEISEGIYIDPPPAVLLSLYPSNETLCLFNYPETQPVTDHNGNSDLILLFHDFPTLYYEPLSKVFETLRNERDIANSYDLANGELVLDAHELVDLAISEDNIHATEVSLHDLNILHDISDLAGPLRIRLECKIPRFIVRYRYLRSELERLNIDGEDKRVTAHTVTELSAEPNLTEYAEKYQETNEKLHQTDATDTSENSQYEDQNANQLQTTESLGDRNQPEQETHDHEHPQYDDEVDGELDADADGETDYGSQLALDAAEGREHSETDMSAPIGGAFTEYEEVEGDRDGYNEKFGEDFPLSREGETVVIEGDPENSHHEDWASDSADDPYLQTGPGQTEGSIAMNNSGEAKKYPGTIDTTGDIDSEDARPEDDATAPQDHEPVESASNEKQVTETIPSQGDGGEEESNYTDPSNGHLEIDLQANPDTDDFGDAEWDEEGLDGELDDVEGGQNDESLSTQSPSKIMSDKASSKRGFDEVDPEEVQKELDPSEVSPDCKRQKVF